MTVIRGRIWRGGQPQKDFDIACLPDYLAQEDTLVWCDIVEPDHAALVELADELGLNTWAVEDAVAVAERTKAVVYRTHTFFTVYGVRVRDPRPTEFGELTLEMDRISGFVLPRGLVTVRLSPCIDVDEVSTRFDELGGQEYGVGALVHGLLDVIVDGHFTAVQELDDGIEDIESELFANNTTAHMQRRTFQLRKDLVELRRVVLPMREVVNLIHHRRMDHQIPHELDPLYADLYDHVLRVSEWTESLRDMITTIFETHLSLQDARLNTIMKKLTSWAAIIAVPTAITGFYGQNVPFPGFNAVVGFVTSALLIVVAVVLLFWTFQRRGWL